MHVHHDCEVKNVTFTNPKKRPPLVVRPQQKGEALTDSLWVVQRKLDGKVDRTTKREPPFVGRPATSKQEAFILHFTLLKF